MALVPSRIRVRLGYSYVQGSIRARVRIGLVLSDRVRLDLKTGPGLGSVLRLGLR